MAGNIANYCSVAANEENRYDKGGVSIEKTLNSWYYSLKFDQKLLNGSNDYSATMPHEMHDLEWLVIL